MTTLEGIEPVSRKSTAGIIADKVRAAIMRGTLEPGTQLGEAELAAQLGVSRGPLREAMQRLVQEGLLRSERHRGLFVIELDEAGILDVYRVRQVIEHAAAQLMLERDDVELVADRLGRVHDRMHKAAHDNDRRALSEADLEFHEAFVAESGSLRLVRMTRTLLVETRMCISAMAEAYEFPNEVVDEHGAMVEAIRAKDEKRLLTLLDAHMNDALRRLTTAYAELSD